MLQVYYCRAWFHGRRIESEPLGTTEAREAYDSRTLYTALIGDRLRPSAFVESNLNYVGLGLLDAKLREYVSYSFDERRPGKMFLSMAVFREFDGEQDKVARAVLYYFREDGNCTVHKEDDIAQEYFEAKPTLNVSANWEPYPAFGEYESISRLDRGLDLIH